MIRILGSGITSLVIAACLDYQNKEFYIDGSFSNNLPNILWLKYDNEEQKELYSDIFKIDLNNFTKRIRIGYLYDNEIYDTVSEDMRHLYLAKQNRKNTSTCLSDGLNSFNIIKLDEIVSTLKSKYADKTYTNLYDFTYDTIDEKHEIVGKSYLEFITNNSTFDMKDYDIVYDCNNSNIKRYTKSTIEYLSEPNAKYTKILNYYDEPKIYKANDKVIIGRNATKTQTKQKDVINYIIKGEGNIYEI